METGSNKRATLGGSVSTQKSVKTEGAGTLPPEGLPWGPRGALGSRKREVGGLFLHLGLREITVGYEIVNF